MVQKLAIIGPVSPPIGGVSIHVERLMPFLEEAGVDYIIYNTAGPAELPDRVVSVAARKGWWFFRYVLFGKEPVIYLLGDKWYLWAATWLLSRVRGKKVVISFPGESVRWAWEDHGRFVRWLIASGLSSADRLIAASAKIRDFLVGIGSFQEKAVVVPAFIPPRWRDEDAAKISQKVKGFCAQHNPVILASGAPVLREGGTDLYGIDMTIKLADRLRTSYPDLGVMWSLLEWIGGVPAYADKMREEVRRRGLGEHWLFSPPQDVFYPVYKMADIFVRPTLSDGDAISIREALHFGVPVVASDAAPRPDGTVLFRSRDQKDFERAVLQTLQDLDGQRERLSDHLSESSVHKEVALLKGVIAEVND